MLTSVLRTLVPVLWGSVIAWLIDVAPLEANLLGVADIILPVITAVIIGAWHAFWRWPKTRLSGWGSPAPSSAPRRRPSTRQARGREPGPVRQYRATSDGRHPRTARRVDMQKHPSPSSGRALCFGSCPSFYNEAYSSPVEVREPSGLKRAELPITGSDAARVFQANRST